MIFKVIPVAEREMPSGSGRTDSAGNESEGNGSRHCRSDRGINSHQPVRVASLVRIHHTPQSRVTRMKIPRIPEVSGNFHVPRSSATGWECWAGVSGRTPPCASPPPRGPTAPGRSRAAGSPRGCLSKKRARRQAWCPNRAHRPCNAPTEDAMHYGRRCAVVSSPSR